jgi:EmrB/QacA subfamily drug resistance transporter
MKARQALRILLAGLGTSVVPLDTAVNIAFPAITESFGLPIQMIQWVIICYVLTYSSLMLAFGRAGDVWSHGRMFRIGLLWSAIAYLLCATAPSYGWLLFCRFLQGIGASLIVSCAPALVTGLFPEDRRSRAVSVFTIMYAIGSAAGPLLGGALVQIWGWPAVFWFRAPLAVTALLFLEGLPAAPRSAVREPIDLVGALLLALAISTLLLMFNQLRDLERQAFLPVMLAAVAVTSIIGFVRWEDRVAQPIVNLGFFRVRQFATANLASVLIYLTSFTVLLFGPYYLVRVADLSAAMAGGILSASFVGSIAASPLAGRLIERRPAGRVAALGALLSGMGLVVIGECDRGTSWPAVAIIGALILQGFGVGLFQVAYMEIVMRTLPRQHRGVAGSIAMLSRSLGVVGGATLLTLAFSAIESFAVAAGQAPTEGFLTSFSLIFSLAGTTSVLAGLLMLAAPRYR